MPATDASMEPVNDDPEGQRGAVVGERRRISREKSMEARVWVFFYGSYMNLDVLNEVHLSPLDVEPAVLTGFDLKIAPRANLIRQPMGIVYGILATATHEELNRLYTEHARGVLGETYLAEAVIVTDLSGHLRPALTYICHEMRPQPADPAYVERVARPAQAYGFPAEYIAKIRSFLPRTASPDHNG